MIKGLLIFSLLVVAHYSSLGQSAHTGFYVLIETKQNCENLLPALKGHEVYCLPKEPIIVKAEFEWISEIKYDPRKQSKYFYLKLSEEGFKILKTLAERLPNSKVALVVDGQVTGIFRSNGKVINRSMPINGKIDSAEVDWIHEKLGKAKP